MHFSLSQQRTAFLTQACLGAARLQPLSPASCTSSSSAQLVALCSDHETQHLMIEAENEAPQPVNPLLLGFNRASSQRSQQSTRANQEELSWRYTLQLVQYQEEYLLIGIQNDNPAAAKLLIGRGTMPKESPTDLASTNLASTERQLPRRCPIRLEPGWCWVRSSYNCQDTQEFYLVQNESLSTLSTSYQSPGLPPPSPLEDRSLVNAAHK